MVTKKIQPRPVVESHDSRGSLSIEPDEIILPGWLNAAKGTRSYDRLMRILDLVRASEESTRNILAKRAYVHTGQGKWPREHIRLWRVDAVIGKQLQSALKRYTFSVRLTGVLFGPRWLLNLYCARRKDEFAWEAPYAYKARAGETVLSIPTFFVSEGDAVLAAARLAEKGLLGRVRLCAMCSAQWFFAKHSNYRFCSDSCRENHYQSTDEYRQKKAQQMREYRSRVRRRVETEKNSFFKN